MAGVYLIFWKLGSVCCVKRKKGKDDDNSHGFLLCFSHLLLHEPSSLVLHHQSYGTYFFYFLRFSSSFFSFSRSSSRSYTHLIQELCDNQGLRHGKRRDYLMEEWWRSSSLDKEVSQSRWWLLSSTRSRSKSQELVAGEGEEAITILLKVFVSKNLGYLCLL